MKQIHRSKTLRGVADALRCWLPYNTVLIQGHEHYDEPEFQLLAAIDAVVVRAPRLLGTAVAKGAASAATEFRFCAQRTARQRHPRSDWVSSVGLCE